MTTVTIDHNYSYTNNLSIIDLEMGRAYLVVKNDLFNIGDIVVCVHGLPKILLLKLNNLTTWGWQQVPEYKDGFIPIENLTIEANV